jgi:hypothetical protein
MKVLVVTSAPTADVGACLVHTLRSAQVTSQACDATDFLRHKSSKFVDTLPLFLGKNKVSAVVGRLVEDRYDKYGVRWGRHRRVSLVWTTDGVVNRRGNLDAILMELGELHLAARSKQGLRMGTTDELTGPELAVRFLESCEGVEQPAYKRSRLEDDHRTAQYQLGIASLLMVEFERWCAEPPTLAPAQRRPDVGHGCMVEQTGRTFRNPLGVAPVPLRTATPTQNEPSSAVDFLGMQLGNLEVEMAKASIELEICDDKRITGDQILRLERLLKRLEDKRRMLRSRLFDLLDPRVATPMRAARR